MNRNVESHFAELPQVEIGRSIFDRSFSHKFTLNVGDLVPFYLDEVLPGDTFDVTTSAVVRLQTLLNPIMDNMYLDTYYFFVPARLTWTHWKEFMGENNESAWVPSTEYSVPYLKYPSGGFDVGTIADYFGIPVGQDPDRLKQYPMALPFRAYALICDQWFRDQNVMDPLNIELGDTNVTGSNGDNYITDVAKGGKPFKACKYHDYFTSALPAPLKASSPVSVALASIHDYFPVGAISQDHAALQLQSSVASSLHWSRNEDYGNWSAGNTDTLPLKYQRTSTTSNVGTWMNNTGDYYGPTNLWGILNYDSSLTINELRLAFQLQKFYEKQARAGSRYRETILEMFGVRSPDARMMIPEYLGGHRFPLNIHQIANTAQGESDFLGDLGAMSNTVDVNTDFVKSFTEHGFVIGVCVIRYDHSYTGLNKMWSRRSKFDYYWPVFANIGEQPVYKRELVLLPVEDVADPYSAGDSVFGYQEAWAEYRYHPNMVSGEMRPDVTGTLASWHLGDDYSSYPSLSASWIQEDKTNVDRVLAVTSSVSNQAFCDFYIQNKVTRAMPVYSIPGLIDHH